MSVTNNLTRFSAINFPSINHKGFDQQVICVACRYKMPSPENQESLPEICKEQPEPHTEDVYTEEPGQSSLLYEGQTTCERPGTDIYLTGHAKTPKEQKVRHLMLSLKVGEYKKQAIAFGDRYWKSGVLGLKPSKPKPFETMPVVYEKSFGGEVPVKEGGNPEYIPENPVGCGFYKKKSQAKNQPLPNIESIKNRIATIKDKPKPTGFGPIARQWKPRVDYAGTYDQDWVENKAPFWPDDFDPRFFHAAAPGLATKNHLKGGEQVNISGFSHKGNFSFKLPELNFLAKFRFIDSTERKLMVLDAIHFEPDKYEMTLIFRTSVLTFNRIPDLISTTIRELESWEVNQFEP